MKTQLSSRIAIICSSLVFLLACHSHAEEKSKWPTIIEEDIKYEFKNASNAHILLDIYSVEHLKLYDLQCHPVDYDDDPLFDYSGLFQCRLVSLYSKEEVGSLLTDSYADIKEWENRGRFLDTHLALGHENYKDWGRKREFNLRGMKITLEMTNEVFASHAEAGLYAVKSFNFRITVRNNPTAMRAISEPPQTQKPEWFY